MNEVIKNKCYSILKVFLIFIGIIVGITIVVIHLDFTYGYLKNIDVENDVKFSGCENYIFNENKNLLTKMDIYTHGGKIHMLDTECHKKYPHKRDYIIEHKIVTETYKVAQDQTKREVIVLPENIVLEKSTIDIVISIPSANITEKNTFFGFSVGKIQNKKTIIIGPHVDNILKKSYTLDEAFYDGDIEFILTNLLGNDLEVNYTVDFYIKY